jgi:lipoprotein-anchoring transpeptidase ErfK/SrfK
MGYNSAPTSTHSNLFAQAQIAKPTYTPSPTTEPSPTPQPTNTPEPVVFAEIVADSSGAISYSGPDQPAPSNPAYSGNKFILVDISEQHMYVYEGDALVYSFVASTGMNNATRVGTFSVLDKIPSAYGATWDIWMPNWLGIYYSGHLENGIHALPILPNGATLWEGYLGVPISYGCVVLGTYESQLLYDWAEVGTPVEIQW